MKYNVGDMFIVYSGFGYSRALLTEIYKTPHDYSFTICWFDKRTAGNYRKEAYNQYEITHAVSGGTWEHYPAKK